MSEDGGMSRRNQEPTFKRRRFTITESLDTTLEDLADQNYQGNVSLCIRAAIEDHKETLDGTDSGLQAQQLVRRVDELASQQERILDSLDTTEEDVGQSGNQAAPSVSAPEGLPENAAQILEALEMADGGLRIDDLTDRLRLSTAQVQPVIGTLVDRGLVTAQGKRPSRYHLAGDTDDRGS
jgi:Fic family protein